MKKLLFAVFLFSSISSSAYRIIPAKLIEVNSEWKNNTDGQILAASVNSISNRIFTDWIAMHLMLVEQTLRQRPVENLSVRQKEKRQCLLNELNSYWHASVFPVNDYLSYKNPVFIDRKGTHCAVGYLMQQSGAEWLTRIIDADNKFVFIKNIKTNGVTEWAFENGFTLDELAWIQPAYPPQFSVDDMAGGLNGSVKTLAVDSSTQLIYAGGSFTASTKGNPCNGVSVYINGINGWDWIGLGNGLNGTVNALLIYNNKLYAGGEFTTAGSVSVSNIAVYDLTTQQWQAMGGLDSIVYALTVFNNEIYAGGKFSGFVSKWTGSQWQDVTQGFLYGQGVRTLEVWDNTLVIGGSFELATGAIRKNVASFDGIYMGTLGMGTVTPVNDFEIFRDTIYAACDVVDGMDTCAIARFVNFDWEVVLKPFTMGLDNFDGQSINYLLSSNDRLFCAGNFSCSSGLFYGNNLMEFRYDAGIQTTCSPLLVVNNVIRTMIPVTNNIVFGGDFSYALSDTLNYVGELFNVITDIPATSYNFSTSLSVYPNPTNNWIRINLNDRVSEIECMIKIFDQTGREILRRRITTPDFTVELSSNLAGGLYFIQVIDREGVIIGSNRIILTP